MGAALRDRFDVMHLLDRGEASFLQTHLAEGMLLHIAVPDTLPSSAVLFVDVWAAFILVVPVAFQLLVLRTVALVRKPCTAGVRTRFLRTSWHSITSFLGTGHGACT